MKKIVMLTAALGLSLSPAAFATSSYAPDASDTESDAAHQLHNSIGLAAVYQENIYAGVDNEVKPFPLLNLTYGDFFIKGTTLGYNTYKTDVMEVAIIGRPSFQGYNADDSAELNGMNSTGALVNVGGQVIFKVRPLVTTVSAVHDFSGNTSGNTLGLKVAAGVPLMDRQFVLIPSVAFTYQDSNIINYYYGVDHSEATQTRPEYSPSNTINTTLGLTARYQVSQHWAATAAYMLTKYGDEVSDSPIVDRATSSTVLLGMSYLFS